MLRTVATAATLAIAATAQADAPQWTLVTETSARASIAYIDRSSVTDLSGKKTVWVLRNYAETINLGVDPVTGAPWYPHRSVKVMYSVDCSAGQVAVSAWQMYNGNFANGEVVWGPAPRSACLLGTRRRGRERRGRCGLRGKDCAALKRRLQRCWPVGQKSKRARSPVESRLAGSRVRTRSEKSFPV